MCVLAMLAVVTTLVAAGASGDTRRGSARAASIAPPASVPALGSRWFALGANVPWISYGCDFGCGLNRGVRGRSETVDRMFRSMSRRGVRTVRWYLFPRDAWQVSRTPDGTPTSLSRAALFDLDVAVGLARKHDLSLVPVVLPEPTLLPATWFTDPAQAAALAQTLRPLFGRYANERHVLAWELATGVDALVSSGVATRDQVRDHLARLRAVQRSAAPGRLAAFGPSDATQVDLYVGLGADLYMVQDGSALPAARRATASASDLATTEGLDAPLVIGGFTASSTAAATEALERYARQGYAGALAWSWRGRPHPAGGGTAPMQDEATWRFHHARPGTGPRSRALNPCYGPDVDDYRCPNLRMSVPSDVSLGRLGSRSILYSTNSLDSRGVGPASLRGTRDGRYTMAAEQVLHRRSGGPVLVPTGARLQFKAIPGQYRYWKWNGAAQMELWRLDSTGSPVERTRVGPKTVYCLRDLRRRFGWIDGSPRARVYPACSQRLSQQSVTLGTSVGWSDVYPASYHENWIDVTGLRGCFAYVHIADPTNVIYESNEDDNASRVVVRLPFTGSNRGCPGAGPLPISGENGLY